MILEETFTSLANRYSNDHLVIEKLWVELKKKYSAKARHYHTLQHLNSMLKQILEWMPEVKDFDTVLFALYYHDVVYIVLRKNNEEKSAQLAEKRLHSLNIPDVKIEACKQHILATKVHAFSDNADTNFFTDADLSILGQSWEAYNLYMQQIRQEYSIYPDLVYRPGRKKVVQHFLQMPKIFKTALFFGKFEQQARMNLQRELKAL